jgi:hypothetical protein
MHIDSGTPFDRRAESAASDDPTPNTDSSTRSRTVPIGSAREEAAAGATRWWLR